MPSSKPARKFAFDIPNIPIKLYHKDLKRLGLVTSRFDQHEKIKAGKLRPPNKATGAKQSAAWWWGHQIAEDLEREINAK